MDTAQAKKPAAPAAAAAPAARPAAAAGPPRGGGGGGKVLAVGPNEPVKFRFSPEDAHAQAEELIDNDIQKGLADAQWKERLASAEALVAWVEGGGADGAESEAIFRFLNKTPGWNEKNFQVGSNCVLIVRRC